MAADNRYAELGSLEREPIDLNMETMPPHESNLPSDVSSSRSAENNLARGLEGDENQSIWRGALRSLGGIGIDRPPNEGGLIASQGQSLQLDTHVDSLMKAQLEPYHYTLHV